MPIDINKIKSLKTEASNTVNALLEEYISSGDESRQKKARLLSYWLKDYCNYLRWEETFDPSRNKKYKRGDIIQANLGYNIGSEEGGLHYAVVMDNDNTRNSPIITIIPLTSVKPETDVENLNGNNVFLGSEIYDKLSLKHQSVSQTIADNIEKLNRQLDHLNELTDKIALLINSSGQDQETIPDDLTQGLQDLLNQHIATTNQIESNIDSLKKDKKNLEKIKLEIDKMKAGSIALINQVTTISKLRIYNPKNSSGVLHGIRLSPAKLDAINDKFKKLYVYD
ncbi:MAG: type II toxin-antitoxin system PemK/MazF family toxin [Clostridiales bacterium]|nr:type II toxin-antitoxin system PemK/MazF family toxin [Clostridiales bacterium]